MAIDNISFASLVKSGRNETFPFLQLLLLENKRSPCKVVCWAVVFSQKLYRCAPKAASIATPTWIFVPFVLNAVEIVSFQNAMSECLAQSISTHLPVVTVLSRSWLVHARRGIMLPKRKQRMCVLSWLGTGRTESWNNRTRDVFLRFVRDPNRWK